MTERALATHREPTTQVMIPRRHLTLEGMEDLTLEEDLILPRWRIVQYSSTIEGEPGQFNNNLTDELRNDLELVVLKITPSRAYFDQDRALVCMSRNGHHSADGRNCLECHLAQWGENREPPPCSRGYTLICLDPKDNSLCLVGALRTSVPSVKRYNSLLAHNKQSPFVFITRFTTEDTKGPKGKYFILGLQLFGQHSPEDFQRYRREYQALAGITIREVEEPLFNTQDLSEEHQEEIPF